MPGICGWVGEVADAEGAHRLLAGMLRDCGAESGMEAPGLREDALHFGCLGDAEEAARRLHSDGRFALSLSDLPQRASGHLLSAQDLIGLYRAHGTNFLRRVRGPFSLALYDRRERALLLAADRIGQRPLYLLRQGARVAFSSQLNALRRLPGFEPRLDHQAIFDYLQLHAIPCPRTIYSGCERLLPAQMVIIKGTGPGWRHFYWRMPYREDGPADLKRLKVGFRELLPPVVMRAAGGERATAVVLNGRSDSAAVAGTLARLRDDPVRTYSAETAVDGQDGIGQAKAMARHLGTDAREHRVTPQDVFEAIPQLAAYCDEPYGNSALIPAYLGARHAHAEGVERLLTGDGADRIFGGDPRYAEQWPFEVYHRIPDTLRNRLIEPLAFGLPRGYRLAPLRRLRRYIDQAKTPLPDRLETGGLVHQGPLDDVFDPAFLATVDPRQTNAGLREAFDRAEATSSLNRLMHMDLKRSLADNDLRIMDQACGLAAVDLRHPFLDQEMMTFAAAVPPVMQVRRTSPRWLLRRALADILPRGLTDDNQRHPPLGRWMAEYEPLRGLTETSLASMGERGILKTSYLDWLDEQHRDAHESRHGTMRWVLVMLEQWLQQHGH